MTITRLSCAAALAFILGAVCHAHADQVPGKGGNCAATWDTGTAAAAAGANSNRPTTITCEDGDPSCDTDGMANGSCSLIINACVGKATQTCPSPQSLTKPLEFSPAITKGVLIHEFAPPGAPPSCGTGGTVVLPLKREPANQNKPLKLYRQSKKVALVMKSKGFVNKLIVRCVPACAAICPCNHNPDHNPNLPSLLSLTVLEAGSDLDNGWTGRAHNFPVVSGATLRYCLSGCDGATNTLCNGFGTTGYGSLNGPTFGAPLPLLAAGVPVCVVNRYQTALIRNTFDLKTGEAKGDVNLFTDVYLTSNPAEVCPRCTSSGTATIGQVGQCSTTARAPGAPCRIDSQVTVVQGEGQQTYDLSSACIPAQSELAGTLDVKLPLTTGEAPPLMGPLPCGDSAGPQLQSDSCDSGTCQEGNCTGDACVSGSGTFCLDAKGGISQACCSDNTAMPCFTSRTTGSITRPGTPGTIGQSAVFAATFCIARTNSSLIDTVTGLPGPGTLLLPAQVR
jgi:hypothetical protein